MRNKTSSRRPFNLRGKLENLKGTDHEFIKSDVRDQSIHEVLKEVDVVVYFAAETHVDRSIYKPQDFVTTKA